MRWPVLRRLRRVMTALAVALDFFGPIGCAAQVPSSSPPPARPTPVPRPAAPSSSSSSQPASETPAPRLTAAGAHRFPPAVHTLQLVPFRASAFPYRGPVPDTGKPFFDVVDGTRRGHTSPRGGVYWEDTTYADRRVLIAIPKGFDPRRPALMVVYFHGNLGMLERDVRDRQRVAQQLAASGANAVLLAPQLAVDALDSSAGHFWEAGHFNRFLREASSKLAEMYGHKANLRDRFEAMPVVVVAYSGGYMPAVYAITRGDTGGRIQGVVLLDALYSEEEPLAAWIVHRRRRTFFVSAYGASARNSNVELQELLSSRRVPVATTLPGRLDAGKVVFLDVGDDVSHGDFVTQAWVADPLSHLLSLIPGHHRSTS